MIRVIAIRPEPGCGETVAKAREMGLDTRGFPLFEVCPVAWEAPDPAQFDALLIGSANALRHAGPALDRYHALPVYAVGEVTAREARQRGFAVAATGVGGLQEVLGRLATGHDRLLRLAGRERVALSPPEKVSMAERVVYASEPRPLPPELAALLAAPTSAPALILLHSAEAARHFAGQCEIHGMARSSIALAALGPRVAEAAGAGWMSCTAAPSPSDEALLALARDLCQTGTALKG